MTIKRYTARVGFVSQLIVHLMVTFRYCRASRVWIASRTPAYDRVLFGETQTHRAGFGTTSLNLCSISHRSRQVNNAHKLFLILEQVASIDTQPCAIRDFITDLAPLSTVQLGRNGPARRHGIYKKQS